MSGKVKFGGIQNSFIMLALLQFHKSKIEVPDEM